MYGALWELGDGLVVELLEDEADVGEAAVGEVTSAVRPQAFTSAAGFCFLRASAFPEVG